MYDEKFPAAIVKAQVDIINVFLVFASIAFIVGILLLIFNKEKRWLGIPLIILPSIGFYMVIIGNEDIKNKLSDPIKSLFGFFYNNGSTLVFILSIALIIFLFIILPFLVKVKRETQVLEAVYFWDGYYSVAIAMIKRKLTKEEDKAKSE